jgi:DNA-binding FrmR family transcriptional regulator
MHTTLGKEKLIARVRRIRGQLGAVERALESEKPCSQILQTVAAARGALNGLVATMIADHVEFHVLDQKRPSKTQRKAADELNDIVRAYLR